MKERWQEVLDSVKAFVNAAPDANFDNGERCRNTWECYALLRWTNGPFTGLYEDSLIAPACAAVCRELSDADVAALLAHQWNDYLQTNDPGVESPRQLSPESRRAVLADVLREAIYAEADSDGAAVEERQCGGETLEN